MSTEEKSSQNIYEAYACTRENKECGPCQGKEGKLSIEKINEHLTTGSLANGIWQLNEEQTKISRKFTAKNFVEAMAFVNQVAAIAEHEGHHPDLHITSWRDVEIVIWTHAANGLTENDFILANLIDKDAKVKYSPKWLKENPSAQYTAL